MKKLRNPFTIYRWISQLLPRLIYELLEQNCSRDRPSTILSVHIQFVDTVIVC